ncbi:hypothetical protein [Nakamurella leprariae]|uniref:Uncharacterized protein n=1 Tax=Nakamurella leprariae TaxID=2803911 RepID=A0A938YCD5_9ACTN|nr:hypothetical protein [Nakamurella leprariae]MBM9467239.1 hypothetical protein [Nakamurella leprariae]
MNRQSPGPSRPTKEEAIAAAGMALARLNTLRAQRAAAEAATVVDEWEEPNPSVPMITIQTRADSAGNIDRHNVGDPTPILEVRMPWLPCTGFTDLAWLTPVEARRIADVLVMGADLAERVAR